MIAEIVMPGQKPYVLSESQYLLGRGADCSILLPDGDATASRHHAILEWDGNASWILEDLQTLNPTHINGLPVNGRHQLHDGDTILMGMTCLTYFEWPNPVAQTGTSVPSEGYPPNSEPGPEPVVVSPPLTAALGNQDDSWQDTSWQDGSWQDGSRQPLSPDEELGPMAISSEVAPDSAVPSQPNATAEAAAPAAPPVPPLGPAHPVVEPPIVEPPVVAPTILTASPQAPTATGAAAPGDLKSMDQLPAVSPQSHRAVNSAPAASSAAPSTHQNQPSAPGNPLAGLQKNLSATQQSQVQQLLRGGSILCAILMAVSLVLPWAQINLWIFGGSVSYLQLCQMAWQLAGQASGPVWKIFTEEPRTLLFFLPAVATYLLASSAFANAKQTPTLLLQGGGAGIVASWLVYSNLTSGWLNMSGILGPGFKLFAFVSVLAVAAGLFGLLSSSGQEESGQT